MHADNYGRGDAMRLDEKRWQRARQGLGAVIEGKGSPVLHLALSAQPCFQTVDRAVNSFPVGSRTESERHTMPEYRTDKGQDVVDRR